jgi:hypothetical protein
MTPPPDEQPTSITPDTKDWTWVLGAECPECGFDASTVAASGVASMISDNIVEWEQVLALGSDDVSRRVESQKWSPLEYASHVRDVFTIYDGRLGLMLTDDGPHYPNWDQDETAVIDRYDLADPAAVAVELRSAGEQLAASFDSVTVDQWKRTGFRSDGAAFTVDTLARYFIHDPIHHLWDVTPA